MNPLKPDIELIEAGAETVVVGSMLCEPDAMLALAADFNPNWVADPGVRLFLDAALKLHHEGHKVTVPLVIAAVSTAVDVPGATRSMAAAQLSRQAVPLSMLSGYVATLKDRWARRVLAREGEQLRLVAGLSHSDPFEAGADAIAALDELAFERRARDVGSVAQSIEQLFDANAAPGRAKAPSIGLKSLDRALGGYLPEQLYVVGGRPGMGKSAFMCSSLRRTAETGDGVMVFSLEMTRSEIAARCLSDRIGSLSAPFYGSILRGLYDGPEMDQLADAYESFKGLPIEVDASPHLTFSEIAARARIYQARLKADGRRLAVVAVDHLGLVDPSNRYAGNKVAEAGEISRAGKILAKQLGCCVLLLAQLNRNAEGREDKRPSLADLRWSGDIEQDADVVAFLYREAYYLGQRPDAKPEDLISARHKLEFLIRKNRNGEASDVPLWCSIGHSSIRDEA